MKRSISLSVLAVLSLLSISCVKSEKKNVDVATQSLQSIAKLDVSKGWEVHVTAGSSDSVRTEIPAHLQAKAVVEQDGETLTLSFNDISDDISINIKNRPIAYITLQQLNNLKCSTGTFITFDTPVPNSGSFTLEAREGCKVDIPSMSAKSCDIQMSQGVLLTMGGKTDYLTLNAEEGCVLKMSKLVALNADVKVSEGVTGSIHVTDSLKVTAKEATLLKCSGSPKFVDKSESEASKVTIL